ncbi:MAG TPA: signal peptide peptidase SppA [Verrucomicrobiae bacterium]|nr:signal peptide peptidase SppA [Verrucomicrobiae bacterium]
MDNAYSPPGAPPPLVPPPVIAPTPPSPPRRGRGWMIFAIILLVLLVFSWFILVPLAASRMFGLRGNFNRGFAAVSSHQGGPRLDEVVLDNNESHNKIAVVTVNGIITSHTADQAGNTMVDVIKAQLDRASDDRSVKAVILKVDSPGGEVMASDQINKLLAKFQKDSSKPVICSMGSLAASGGYYISVPCRWIEANEMTLTASIGVIMEGLNYRHLMDKIGVEPNVYKSGVHKDMLSGMRSTNEIPADEHQMVQALIMETYGDFTNVVVQGRSAAHRANGATGTELATNWMEYADGRVVSGKQALKLGLVDGIGDFDDAVDKAKEIVGIQRANLVEYRERYDLSDFLSMFGQSSRAHDIKLDFGVEAPKLQAGERYFLWLPPED